METELLKQLKTEFDIMKKELGFKSSFKDIDEIFFFKDMVLKEGFVSQHLSRMMCRRIVDTYGSWLNYLHGIVVPNPNYMIALSESQAFSDEEKNELISLMNKIMALISINQYVGITKNKKKESEFIDESVKFWKKTMKLELKKITKKINDMWKEK